MAERNDSDSIYRAPDSDIAVTPEGDNMSVFVGPRYDTYYSRVFSRFETGSSASWHWPAFFVAAFWLLYRKMWALTLVYWFVLPLVLMVIAVLVSSTQTDSAAQILYVYSVYYGLYAIVAFILVPIFANRLYYRHAKKKIAKISARIPDPEQQRLEIARKGGTSNVLIVILPIVIIALVGILAAIAIPAYQDYTIRAQISEGLNIASGAKAAVMEYHADNSAFPQDNETAGLMAPDDLSGNYVNSVSVYEGTIVVEYGRDAHSLIQGLHLVLEPYDDGSFVEWACYSETIADKHLPAACR